MEIEQIEEYVKGNPAEKYRLTLSQPYGVWKHTRLTGHFFRGNWELAFAHGNARRGYGISQFAHLVTGLETMTEQSREERVVECARIILKRCHPFAWADLRAELEVGNYRGLSNSKLTWVNVKKHLTEGYSTQLGKAFDQRLVFRWYKNSTARYPSNVGRDLSIETKLSEDGVFRAWYSSEYPGCGNGQYYLLISPQWAFHCEDD